MAIGINHEITEARWIWDEDDDDECLDLLDDIDDDCDDYCEIRDDDYNQEECEKCCKELCKDDKEDCKMCCNNLVSISTTKRPSTRVPIVTTKKDRPQETTKATERTRITYQETTKQPDCISQGGCAKVEGTFL